MSFIKIFSLSEFNIDANEFTKNIKSYYHEYEYDEYLYRQDIIKHLVENKMFNYITDYEIIKKFYLSGNTQLLKLDSIKSFNLNNIQKYRKRLICSFKIDKNGSIERFFSKSFEQKSAATSEKN